MKYSRDDIRLLTAQDYARRATRLDEDALPDLFDTALREGEITGLAAAVELAIGKGDLALADTLKALVPAARGTR